MCISKVRSVRVAKYSCGNDGMKDTPTSRVCWVRCSIWCNRRYDLNEWFHFKLVTMVEMEGIPQSSLLRLWCAINENEFQHTYTHMRLVGIGWRERQATSHSATCSNMVDSSCEQRFIVRPLRVRNRWNVIHVLL